MLARGQETGEDSRRRRVSLYIDQADVRVSTPRSVGVHGTSIPIRPGVGGIVGDHACD